MTRGAVVGALLLVALVVGITGAVFVSAGDEAGQGGAYEVQAVASIPADWVRVEWYQDAGGGLHAVVVSTPLPPSPTATRAPTATPSLTPPATNTPRPTATSTPTVTRPADASPTPERTPPPTPPPQPTTIPPDNVCYGTVIATTLRLRTDAGIGASVVGGLVDGQRVRVLDVKYVGADEWAQVLTADGISGWAAAWYGKVTFITFADSLECSIIRFGDKGLRIGPHTQFNASLDRLAGYLRAAGVVKEVSGSGAILAAARAANPRVVTVYRTTQLGDCAPDGITGGQWIDMLAAIWPSGATWYEPLNECGETSHSYSNDFTLQMVKRANERGLCLLLYAYSVGWPSESAFEASKPVWDYVLTNPCQPGRTHSLALHAYGLGYERENTWIFSRWRRLCAGEMAETCERIGIWFTEWEHYEKESDPVDCARMIDNIRWAKREYKGTPIRGIMLWNFGGWGWRDCIPCSDVLALAG